MASFGRQVATAQVNGGKHQLHGTWYIVGKVVGIADQDHDRH